MQDFMQFDHIKNTLRIIIDVVNLLYIVIVNIHKKTCGICTANFRRLLQTLRECCIMNITNVPNGTKRS